MNESITNKTTKIQRENLLIASAYFIMIFIFQNHLPIHKIFLFNLMSVFFDSLKLFYFSVFNNQSQNPLKLLGIYLYTLEYFSLL